MKKVSIRMRLTVLVMLLLSICCVGLTIILNFSAFHMVNTIEATRLQPAIEAGSELEEITEEVPLHSAVPAQPAGSQDARTDFLYRSILYVVLIIAVGGVLIYYISGKALKPLQELNMQMKNRTVHNLSEGLPVPETHDEIVELTVSFNQMSERLDEAFAMQKRFSQSAAHELRTPLTVLKTKVDVFRKKRERTLEEYDKLLVVIAAHTDRLSGLVKNLLELTNMDAVDCRERVELKALLSEVVQELMPFGTQKQISIRMEGDEKEVRGNKILLHRAFYNLIENALKYNRERGTIEITIADTQEGGVVTVYDTGIGIAPEQRGAIFEPFFRVDKSRSRKMGGSGLGLSTVKAIIDKHDGQILVSANEEGGSCFTVILS